MALRQARSAVVVVRGTGRKHPPPPRTDCPTATSVVGEKGKKGKKLYGLGIFFPYCCIFFFFFVLLEEKNGSLLVVLLSTYFSCRYFFLQNSLLFCFLRL